MSMVDIKVSQIATGKKLEVDIYDPKTGAKVLSKDTMITKEYKEKLEKLGISYINITREDKTLNSELKSEFIQGMNEFVEELFEENIKEIPKSLRKSSSNITSVINRRPQLHVDLTEYFNTDAYLKMIRIAQFAVNVAKIYNRKITALFRARINTATEEGAKRYKEYLKKALIDLREISLAAVLSSIGSVCKDKKENLEFIKNKKAVIQYLKKECPGIDDKCFEEYDENYLSVYSFCLLSGKNVSLDLKKMVLLSNEGEKKEHGILQANEQFVNSLNKAQYGAKIIKLCSVYDEELKKVIKEKMPLEHVTAALDYYASIGIINPQLLEMLLGNIKLYPEYTKVELSDGKGWVREGLVIESPVGRANASRPKVRVSGGEVIDLSEEPSILITKILENLKYDNENRLATDIFNDHRKEIAKNVNYFPKLRKKLEHNKAALRR